MTLKYYNPVKIIKTLNWSNSLNSLISELNIFKPLIMTSTGNYHRQNFDEKLSSNSFYLFSKQNPTFEDCTKLIAFCKAKKFDGIIAIGGGSVMDLAKVAMSFLALRNDNILELINYKSTYNSKVPSVFLPTTHGTASEVTKWGTIWDMQDKKKYSISHNDLYPSYAILDPTLTVTLPLDISITTVLDALSHSFEAIWNKNSNKVSTEYAIEAIDLILKNGMKLKNNLDSLDLRKNLLHASSLAGLAFSNTATAAAHSISYPLTIRYGIPHGIAASMSLVELLKINSSQIANELGKIEKLTGHNLHRLIEKINQIPNDTVSMKLRDWGVDKNDIENLSSECFTKGRMDNNIVNLNRKDVQKILINIY